VQRGWYDRKHRRVRDLACGDLRIYLDVEVRRVACRQARILFDKFHVLRHLGDALDQVRKSEYARVGSASLWDYGREGWAHRFFEHWRAALKWQRLGPYEKFAALIAGTGRGSRPTAARRTRSPSASSRD
jgi:hypothetical protein